MAGSDHSAGFSSRDADEALGAFGRAVSGVQDEAVRALRTAGSSYAEIAQLDGRPDPQDLTRWRR